MPFIGNQPADKFLTLEKQVFTTSATDTYSLDREVSSVNDIELFLNNVRQEPTEAYTISGTTLTLASAITASDSMYCIYQGRAVGTQSPAVGSVTNDMLVNSSITLNGTAVSLGGSANVGIVNLGTTTVTGTPSEIDIDFDTSTYKQFRIFFEGIQGTADFNMYARAKVGGTVDTSSVYASLTVKKYATGFDSSTYGGGNQSFWYVSHNIGADTFENWGGDLLINIGSGTGMPQITMTTSYKDSGGGYVSNFGGLIYQNFNIINGFRLYPSTGNFDAGKYTVWGIK